MVDDKEHRAYRRRRRNEWIGEFLFEAYGWVAVTLLVGLFAVAVMWLMASLVTHWP
jgi:hypothetical protein